MSAPDHWPKNLVKAYELKHGPIRSEEESDPQHVVATVKRYDVGFDRRVEVTWHVEGSGNIVSPRIVAELAALSSTTPRQTADRELAFLLEEAYAALRSSTENRNTSVDAGEKLSNGETVFDPNTKEFIAHQIVEQVHLIQSLRLAKSNADEVGLAWKELARLEAAFNVVAIPHPNDPKGRPALELCRGSVKRVFDTRNDRQKWHNDAIDFCNRRLREEALQGQTLNNVQLAVELQANNEWRRSQQYLEQLVGDWVNSGLILRRPQR